MGPTLLGPAPGVDLKATLDAFGTSCGVPGLEKDAADLDRYEEIIKATRPTTIVECGTNTGASARWFAARLPRVVTIDIDPERCTPVYSGKVVRLAGDSTSPEILGEVRRLTDGWRVMVSLDSDHSRTHVATEIALFAGLVSPGCYLVIEDGIYHWCKGHGYDGDPLEAISAMMPARGDYVRDLDIEGRYPTTGAIAGWWRREFDRQ